MTVSWDVSVLDPCGTAQPTFLRYWEALTPCKALHVRRMPQGQLPANTVPWAAAALKATVHLLLCPVQRMRLLEA